MTRLTHYKCKCIGLLVGFCSALALTASANEGGACIVGIDHIPTVVANLDEASEEYRALGFALKSGRFHADGLHNSHVKFEDGSGIELISPPLKPTDDLAVHYSKFLREGDGPAFLGLHVRDADELQAALRKAGLKTKAADAALQLDEPLLDFLFIDQDNRSPTDRPEHFAHSNSAFAMTGVWLALEPLQLDKLRVLLTALGARESSQSALVPHSTHATVFTVQNGRIVVVGKDRQLHIGRPIIGVEFRVRDIGQAACARDVRPRASSNDRTLKRCFVPAAQAHGLWLEFQE